MQQQHSYVRGLLYSIAPKLGRKPQDMDLFIKKLQDQWYDTKDALSKLSSQDYSRLQIPDRLAMMIIEAVGAKVSQTRQEKMDIESPVESYLDSAKSRLNSGDFDIIISTLHRIFHNIRQSLINEKFRTLKKSNQKIAALTSVPEVVKVLRFGGFQDKGDSYIMTKVNISGIDECLETVAKYLPKTTFNPYESSIISAGKTTVQNYEGESSVQYNKMLDDLEKERTRIMSQPIYDRKIRIYQIQPHFIKQFDRQFQEERESQDEDKYIELENLKRVLKKSGEEPKFINRRMQEYENLVKQPVFAETIIRVKLPQNWIFECRFSPMEPLRALVDIFRDCLVNPNLDYYLYMTPPVQKLSGLLLYKNFYDLGCVPRAIFYMKCEQQLKGNLFKIGVTKKNF